MHQGFWQSLTDLFAAPFRNTQEYELNHTEGTTHGRNFGVQIETKQSVRLPCADSRPAFFHTGCLVLLGKTILTAII